MTFVEDAEAQIRSFYGSENPAGIETEVLGGAPQRAIVERARDWGADLIVVGSHGYGFWSRALLGSISNAVVNHAPCSVLVVR
jgi:nucleotide-binding universal stress UspA family protein